MSGSQDLARRLLRRGLVPWVGAGTIGVVLATLMGEARGGSTRMLPSSSGVMLSLKRERVPAAMLYEKKCNFCL